MIILAYCNIEGVFLSETQIELGILCFIWQPYLQPERSLLNTLCCPIQDPSHSQNLGAQRLPKMQTLHFRHESRDLEWGGRAISMNSGSLGAEPARGLGKMKTTSLLAFWGRGRGKWVQQTVCSGAGAPRLGATAERSRGPCRTGMKSQWRSSAQRWVVEHTSTAFFNIQRWASSICDCSVSSQEKQRTSQDAVHHTLSVCFLSSSLQIN